MRTTLVIMTKHVDTEQINTLVDALQSVKNVFSVSVVKVDHGNPDQLPLWPDEPAEQKLLPVPTREEKMQAVRDSL